MRHLGSTPNKLKQRISRSLGLSLWFFKDLVLRPPILETVTWFTQKSSQMGRMGTSLFNWTNESPLFFRGPSWSSWQPLFAAGEERRRARAKRNAFFTNTNGLRWPPSDGSLRSGTLRHCQFCLFFDGPSPLRSAQNSAGFQTLSRPFVFAACNAVSGRCGKNSER